jgi:SAM-dependent methyltransferase
MTLANELLRRQYDLCQRYRLVAQVLVAAFPDEPVSVLDVGSGDGDLLRAFLPDRFAIVTADVDPRGRSDIVRLEADAPLPFAAGAFAAAVAMDVLEHVPAAARSTFVGELARVAKRLVVLSHPVAHPAVQQAEDLLAAAHRCWLHADSHFLAEHREHGLPAATLAVDVLAGAGLATASFANCPLRDWLPLTILDVVLLAQFGVGEAKDEFNLAANEIAHDLVTPGEHYRTFVVGARAADLVARVTAALAAAGRPRRPEHDQSVQELIARTVVKLAERPAANGLSPALAAKDSHIHKLETLLQAEVARLHAELGAVVHAKDEHIHKLEALLRAETVRLETELASVVRAKDAHIHKLEALLQERGDQGRSARDARRKSP